jgi:hypothetical protein
MSKRQHRADTSLRALLRAAPEYLKMDPAMGRNVTEQLMRAGAFPRNLNVTASSDHAALFLIASALEATSPRSFSATWPAIDAMAFNSIARLRPVERRGMGLPVEQDPITYALADLCRRVLSPLPFPQFLASELSGLRTGIGFMPGKLHSVRYISRGPAPPLARLDFTDIAECAGDTVAIIYGAASHAEIVASLQATSYSVGRPTLDKIMAGMIRLPSWVAEMRRERDALMAEGQDADAIEIDASFERRAIAEGILDPVARQFLLGPEPVSNTIH